MTALLLDAQELKPHDLAREVYQQAPTNSAYASTYAFSLHLQKKDAEALKVMQQLPPKDLENPSIAGYYGLILKATGNPAKAKVYLQWASKAQMLPEEKKLFDRAKAGAVARRVSDWGRRFSPAGQPDAPTRCRFFILSLVASIVYGQLMIPLPGTSAHSGRSGLSCWSGSFAPEQSASDYAVRLSATVQSTPARITLSWPGDPQATSYTVNRKSPRRHLLGQPTSLGAGATSYADSTAAAGTGYEYRITKTAPTGTSNYTAYGYIYAGINLPARRVPRQNHPPGG